MTFEKGANADSRYRTNAISNGNDGMHFALQSQSIARRGALIAALAVLALFLGACEPRYSGKRAPEAERGVLDLRGWDFAADGPLRLSGDWEFYWRKILAPGDFTAPHPPEGRADVPVPGNWDSYTVSGERLPAWGYATYRVSLLLPDHRARVGLELPDIGTAYTLTVDGRVLASSGAVGTSRETTVPRFSNAAIGFQPDSDRVEILLAVANFHHVRGGILDAVLVGREDQISVDWNHRINILIFLFGILVIMGLYHLVLFLLRPAERTTLYFGLSCLSTGIYLLSMGERYLLEIFPSLTWAVHFRIVMGSYLGAVLFFLLFLDDLFPRERVRAVLRSLVVLLLLMIAWYLVVPTFVSTAVIGFTQLVQLLTCLYCIGILARAIARGRHGAYVLLAGYTVFFLAVVIEVLHLHSLLRGHDTHLAVPIGCIVFVVAHAYMIANRFARAFEAEEKLTRELANTQKYLNNVFDSVASVLIAVDADCAITHWNASAEAFWEVPAAAALRKPLGEVVPFLGTYEPTIRDVMSTQRSVELPKEKASDTKRVFGLGVSPLVFDGVRGAVIRVDDVTEAVRKDEQLLQAQKMETVGNLAGGLSHDFNNVLSGIVGAVSLVEDDLRADEERHGSALTWIDLIKKSAGRASELVRQLLTLSKKQEPALAPADLKLAVEHVLAIGRNTIDKTIEIRAELPDECAMAMADPGQIEQVLLNLCINAAHAMTVMRGPRAAYGGVLEISLARMRADADFCARRPRAREGSYWIVKVSDTGVGMDAATCARVFDPFFTTKEEGTGLGLAMAYAIVAQHAGFIEVCSTPESGSTFTVFLPEHEGRGLEETHDAPAHLPRGTGLILVVEDEEHLRRLDESMLRKGGYEVLSAADGHEAIELYRARSRSIRGVLLDMAMPKLSGKDTYVELRRIDASVKVLMTSGFRQDPRVREALALGVAGFIQKPYSLRELLLKARAVFG
jgi:signal transduction histidine kinase/CheY-like chemotaxis protein